MAVEIPVVVDIEKAFQDAAKRVGTAMKPMQQAVDEETLEVVVEINKKGEVAEVLDFVGKTKMSMEQLKYAIKSVNQQLEQMYAKEGGNIDFSQGQAKSLMQAKIILQDILEQRGDVSREIERSIKLVQQEAEAERQHQAALNANVNTMAGLNQRLSALTQDMANADILSGPWQALAMQVEQVSKRMAEVNAWAKEIGAGSGSIDQLSARLQRLNIEWNNLASSKKFNGNELSSEAKGIYEAYKNATKELQRQGLSLDQMLQKEQKRSQLISQGQQKRRYETAIMNATAKTMTVLQEKERILSERLNRTEVGTSKYEKLKTDLQDVRREIERINKDISGQAVNVDVLLGKADNKLTNLVKNSARLVALHSASSFIRNVREVTSEFEMQRVALAGIIQDTEQATALFKQIKTAALKSPFEIKDLVTYTKQLSAYRIETDRLFDVTMQLADVSAGLGVDMNRLVLAYGQVRAASVLRGQELRQFTEAGIPLVELLADKFTELNGRMTSTADVFDLISKRAVPFSMIEEIFDDMTSAGGMFYKMQEKQSETLLGQWMKLKDALSIMYDEIGNTTVVHSAMEKLMADAMTLMHNWRLVGGALKAVVTQFIAIKVASIFMPTLARNVTLAKKATDAFSRSLAAAEMAAKTGSVSFQRTSDRLLKISMHLEKASLTTNVFKQTWHRLAASLAGGGWVGIAITAVTALIGYLISARQEAQRLGKALAENISKGDLQIEQAQRNFRRLADAAVVAADGTAEQREALKELQRTYGDVIPSQDLQIEKLKELKGNYDALTDAIKDKIDAQIHEQNVNEITESYGASLGSQRKGLEKFLKKEAGYTTEEASRIIEGVNFAIKKGLLTAETDFFDAAKIIEDIIEEQIGEKARPGVGQAFQQVSGFFATRSYYKNLLRDTQKFNTELEEEEERFDALSNTMGVYAKKLKEIREDLQRAPEGFTMKEAGTYEFNEARWKQAVARYKEELTEALGDSISDAFSRDDFIDFSVITEKLSLLEGESSGKLKSFVEAIQKDYLKIAPQDATTRLVTEAAKRFASEIGVSMSQVQGYLKKDETEMTEYASSVEGFVKTQKERIAELEFLRKNYREGISNYKQPTIEDISKEKDELAFLERLLSLVQEFLSTSKSSGKKSALSFLKEELKNVQEIYKRYKEFVEYLGEAGAREEIQKIYGGVTAIDFLNPQDYKKRLGDILRQIRELQGKVKTYNHEVSAEMFNDIKETIKKNEGLRLEAYKLPGEAYYTIGYGFYKSLPDGRQITEGMKLTTEEAERLLDQYVKTYSSTAERLLADYGQGLELTDKQFNVLVDLAYQGPNALKKALIKAKGDVNALAEALKDAAWPLVAPKLQEAVKKRDMKRYAAFMAGMSSDDEAKDILEAAFDAERLVQDVDWSELQDELEKSLKRLSENIKRSETARNFFNNILELTGDQQLAADLSVSIYGGIGKDFKGRIQEQLYEALNSLDAIGIDKDLLSEVQGDITLFDIDAIKANLDKLPPKVKEVFQKALEDNEKYTADWYTDFIKTFRKAKTYEERINTLEAQKQKKVSEAREMGMTESDVAAVIAYYNKEIAGVQLEAMKDTYTWTKAFEDLEGVSDQTLTNLINLIDEYVEKYGKDLEPQQLKELARSRENAKQQLLSRNAYKATGNAIKDLISASKRYTDLQAEGKENTEEGAKAADDYKEALKRLSNSLNQVYSDMDDVVSKTKDLMSVFASDDDASYFSEQLDNITKTVKGAGTAAVGIGRMLLGDISPQAIMQTLTGLADVVTGIFGGVNAKQVRDANKEYEKQAKILQTLDRTYNQLEKSIDEAFGNDAVTRFTEQLKVLQAQQDAYLAQAANREEAAQKESTKKNKKRYEEEAEEAKAQAMEVGDAMASLRYEISSTFAGSDLSSAAESFADAWLEAYQEFGDTSTAIEERMTEMVQNIVKKAALSGIAKGVLGNWYDSLADVTDWNAQTIAEKWKEAMGLVGPMVEGMQTFANSMQAEGVSLRNTVGQFTGISRDFAGASEESINGLTAGVNTQNFYMSFVPLIHENVAQILTYMTGGNTVTPSTESGIEGMPSVQTLVNNHLPSIDANINSILQLLRSVISVGNVAPRNYVAAKM